MLFFFVNIIELILFGRTTIVDYNQEVCTTYLTSQKLNNFAVNIKYLVFSICIFVYIIIAVDYVIYCAAIQV